MTFTELPSWQKLEQQALQADELHLAELLHDEQRQQALSFDSLANFYVDFSKQRLTEDSFNGLLQLASDANLSDKIKRFLGGDIVNPSENRPALHTVLRALDSDKGFIDNANYADGVNQSLNVMQVVIDRLYQKQWTGFSDKAITDVVNIGVGGSDLGPVMANFAMQEFSHPEGKHLSIHFASTIDGSQLAALLPELNPETTLFCYVSKSFTTIDTSSNADTAMSWLTSACSDEAILKQRHFIGISANPQKMTEWGIPTENQITFWEWVGGRYSMWSAVGFVIALRIGMDAFKEFLDGANQVDQHLANTPLEQNIPVLMALMDIWNNNFMGINTHAILPYDGRLKYFPAYLGQLEMESNGKSVTLDEEPVDYKTCPILWGEVGPNAQHAFFQLLHQGTELVNADFIIYKKRHAGSTEAEIKAFETQQTLNMANCLAQSRLLALGNASLTEEDQDKLTVNQQYPGNQPSTTIVIDELTPTTLGSLVALYEHKVFAAAAIWNINPFDQWGVELGKKIAIQLQPILEGAASDNMDASTIALVSKLVD